MADVTTPSISKSSPARILGQPSTPIRSRTRYSYPISDTEWTEYTSPLQSRELGFFVDSVGDRSLLPSMFPCHECFTENIIATGFLDVEEDLHSDNSADAPTLVGHDSPVPNPPKATNPPENVPHDQIRLSPEQQHVLDLVREGRK